MLAASFRTRTLGRPRPGVLVLAPARGLRLWTAAICGIAVLALLQGATDWRRGSAAGQAGGTLAVAAVLSLCGAMVLRQLTVYEFDRATGRLTVRSPLGGTARPLADVLAVHLVPGGRDGTIGQRTHETYQLNLVVGDVDRPRLNLSNDTALTTAREAGAELAALLEVPLVDLVSGRT